MLLSRQVLVALLLLLLGFEDASGQQPLAKRVDQYGDPLPEGAIARLGTLRLTHLGGVNAVAVSPDGKIAASGVGHGKTTYLDEKRVDAATGNSENVSVQIKHATIRLWNTKSGELIGEIQTPDAPVSSIQFATDRRRVFAACGKFVCCWDTGSGKMIWERKTGIGGRFDNDVTAENMALRELSIERELYFKVGDKADELRDMKTDAIVRRLENTAGEATNYFSGAGNRLVRKEDGWFSFFDHGQLPR